MLPKPEWIETALKVTGHFEDSNDPLAGVSGDFDGMGISLGVLQWNIGAGSLQPLVQAVGRTDVLELMPAYGNELWAACTSPIPHGLAIVRGWHRNGKLPKPCVSELKQFLRSDRCIAKQIAQASDVAERAYTRASAWTGRAPTLTEFCWFFDLLTQNGGLKDVSPQGVDSFIAAARDKAGDLVCDWLASRTSTQAGYKDAHKNADLWRGTVQPAQLSLFVASYLRAQRSTLRWRADVLNRKATLAVGLGWVHGEKHDLRGIMSRENGPLS